MALSRGTIIFLFMTGCSFVTWSNVFTDVVLLLSHRNWGKGHYYPWCLHFKEMTPKFLRKTFLNHKIDQKVSRQKAYLAFRKICIYFKDMIKYFTIKNVLRQILWKKMEREEISSPIFNMVGDLSFLICICLYMSNNLLTRWNVTD